MTDPHSQLELAQQYAAGQLEPAAAAVFEEHLVACEQCQTEVRLAAGVRRLVRDAPATRAAYRARWIGGASVLLAAGIAAVLVRPSRVDPKLAALGHVLEPPAYLGTTVRSLPQRGDSLFNAAMSAYTARRYEEAASDLRSALAAGVDTVPARFYLASAELMAGHPPDAAADYARVIGAGANAKAYLPEAHLYRARALLRLGIAQAALADLRAVPQTDAMTAARASALADSVSKVLQR